MNINFYLYKFIYYLSIACVCAGTYQFINTLILFGIRGLSGAIFDQIIFCGLFICLIITAYKQNLKYATLSIFAGILISHFFMAITFLEWLRVAFPIQIIDPLTFSGFISGISALFFIIIILIVIALWMMKLVQYLKIERGSK